MAFYSHHSGSKQGHLSPKMDVQKFVEKDNGICQLQHSENVSSYLRQCQLSMEKTIDICHRKYFLCRKKYSPNFTNKLGVRGVAFKNFTSNVGFGYHRSFSASHESFKKPLINTNLMLKMYVITQRNLTSWKVLKDNRSSARTLVMFKRYGHLTRKNKNLTPTPAELLKAIS